MKVGKGSKTRIIDIDMVKAAIASKMHAQISSQSRALKLLLAKRDYVAAFSNTWIVSAHLLSKLEEFVCALYGKRLSNFSATSFTCNKDQL